MGTLNAFENFRLFPAYSIETLAEALAREIEQRDDPFVPETILITNYAQRIWLQHYLAQKNGICANIRFASPESFLDKISNCGNSASRNTFDRDALAWRIFKTLRELHAPENATQEELCFRFRENREEDLIQTAQTLADLFWRYQSFRTEMIVAWTRGEDIPELSNASETFKFEYARQKNLWQKLALRDEEIPAMRYRNFYEGNYKINTENLPKRLFVFAPTALPKTHFEMLKKLSEHTPILFYYHNLSENFWVESRNQKSNLAKPESAERGNEMLTSWGKAARALANGLIECNLLGNGENLDQAPERDSLLHRLQADIRENIVREDAPAEDDLFAAAFPPAEGCVSLRIHAAHSRMREMEILRDDLRDLTARDPAIRPRDILVMLPDIDAYAPFIRTVFGDSEFPFSLADSADAARFGGITAFLSLLKIAQGEMRLSEISELFDSEALTRALKLDEDDVRLLRKILIASNLRWGADACSRERRFFESADALPEDSDACSRAAYNHSWRFGLRRCALGVMTETSFSETDEPLSFGDNREILPSENLPENAAELLGKFFRVFEAATTIAAHYSGNKKSVAEWCRFLKCDLADTLFEFSDDEIEESAMLADAIDSVRQAAENAGIGDLEVELKTVVQMLENRSWESRHGAGMLRGKITFCRLQPLRNIPAKAIYIAGMNPGEFPRPARKSALDLIAQWPGVLEWDRTPRDEDCLLLLEAVLAAKTYLRFSYIGRNAKNNFVIHPCTPLSKFIDEAVETLIPQHFSGEAREKAAVDALRHFFFEHGPQSPETEKLSDTSSEKQQWRPPFLGNKGLELSPREHEMFSSLTVDQIAEFLSEPAKFFCENRLRLMQAWKDKAISDADPESAKVKTKQLFPQLIGLGLGALSAPGVERQNEIVESMLEALGKTVRQKKASGDFPVNCETESLAVDDNLRLKYFKRNQYTWAQTLGKEFLPTEKSTPVARTLKFEADAKAFPSGVTVRLEFDTLRDADEAFCCVKSFPRVYSTAWEFKIHAAVYAAFIKEAIPETKFTFIALHPNFVSRKQDSVLKIDSDAIPDKLALKLLRRFFEGMENPPPFFAGMPLPESDDADTFFKKFSDEAGKSEDFARPFREFLFGSAVPAACADAVRGNVFEFAREIATLFPQPKKKK